MKLRGCYILLFIIKNLMKAAILILMFIQKLSREYFFLSDFQEPRKFQSICCPILRPASAAGQQNRINS